MGRKKSTERKGYFYEKEEQAVIDYINAETKQEKNRIFDTILYPALSKMVESIIRRYKLYVPDEEFYQTFNDTMSYLLTKLNNFKPDKGFKAYSYCGTICKNYLYYKGKQHTKQVIQTESYDDIKESLSNKIKYSSDSENSKENLARDLIEKTAEAIEKMLAEPEKNSLREGEIKVGKALVDLLKNWEGIITEEGSNKLQKSSVLYFLREETMMTTNEIRDNMKPYKEVYKILREIELK